MQTDNEITSYQEAQRFTQWWIQTALWIAPLITLYALSETIIKCRPFQPSDWVGLCIATIASFGTVFWFRWIRLLIEVRPTEIRWKYVGLHWNQQRLPISEIATCEAVTYRPILEYGGWGIRYGKTGKCYNVSGNRGVLLTLTNKKTILFGSQQPEQLAAAIQSRVSNKHLSA